MHTKISNSFMNKYCTVGGLFISYMIIFTYEIWLVLHTHHPVLWVHHKNTFRLYYSIRAARVRHFDFSSYGTHAHTPTTDCWARSLLCNLHACVSCCDPEHVFCKTVVERVKFGYRYINHLACHKWIISTYLAVELFRSLLLLLANSNKMNIRLIMSSQ